MEGRKEPVHQRLYQDYFDRQANRDHLLRHLDSQRRGLAHPTLWHWCDRTRRRVSEDDNSLREERLEGLPRGDSRLKVPVGAETTESFEPRRGNPPAQRSPREASSVYSSPAACESAKQVQPPHDAPKPRSAPIPPAFTPIISPFYSQLTPFNQSISYAAGCDRKKILKTGKQMIRYTDSKAMFEALSQAGKE